MLGESIKPIVSEGINFLTGPKVYCILLTLCHVKSSATLYYPEVEAFRSPVRLFATRSPGVLLGSLHVTTWDFDQKKFVCKKMVHRGFNLQNIQLQTKQRVKTIGGHGMSWPWMKYVRQSVISNDRECFQVTRCSVGVLHKLPHATF